MHKNCDFQLLKQFIHKHANCSRTEWACQRNCRLQFVDRSTGLCKRPHHNDQCFGIPIRYNYTLDATDVFTTLDRYTLISRFPREEAQCTDCEFSAGGSVCTSFSSICRCWSALGPLLCAVAYRPCSNRSYFELTMTKPGFMEMWQVFRKDMCHRAMGLCAFVVDGGLWPSFVNCSHSSANKIGRQLFSDGSCKMPYNKEPAVVDRNQCLWPLVQSIDTYRDAMPVIDDCYMPCRSPLLSSEGIHNTFKGFVFAVSLIVVILASLCFGYTSFFASLWLTNLCVYALGHALLSTTIHWLIWLTGLSDGIAQVVMCIARGRIRRDSYGLANGMLQWYNIESWLLHTSLLSACFWLCSFIVLRLGRPSVRKDHRIYVDGHPEMSIRCVLLVIYLIAAIIATIALWMDTAECDGVMGVCYIGLRSFSNASTFIYVPILSALVVALIIAACIFFRRRYEALLELEAQEENARQQSEAIKAVNSGHVSVSDSSNPVLDSMSAMESQPFVAPSDGVSNEKCAVVEDHCNDNDADLANQKVGEGKAGDVAELRPARRIYRRKKDGCGYAAISRSWLYAIILSMVISLFASWFTHLKVDVERDWEQRLVLNSIRCSLNETILKGSTDWLSASHHSDHIMASSDPLIRRGKIGISSLNAPGCELPTAMDDRLLATLLTFILFPAIPYIVLVACFISGFCGHGLKGIEKIREKLNPFVVEKTALAHTSSSSMLRNSSSDELELLPSWSLAAQERVSKWTGAAVSAQTAPARICSSANCLSRALREGSTHSQTLSEPADPTAERPSRIRRLNLMERSAERRRHQGVSFSSSAISEVEARLSRSNFNMLSASASESALRRSEPTLDSADARSVYSGWSPVSAPSSFNMTSASQQRDPVLQTAAVVSAYQAGLVEGRYQERCDRYAEQIKCLTESLEYANKELRRISGLPPSPSDSDNGMHAVERPAVSELSEIRGTPYPDAASTPVFGNRTTTNGRTASLKNQKEAVNDDTQFAKSHNQKKDGADERSGSSSSRDSIQCNGMRVEGQSGMFRQRQQVSEKECVSVPRVAMSSRIIKESSRKGENSEGGNRETVTGSENSDSFNSDEEDSEEERFFAEVLREAEQERERQQKENTALGQVGETPTPSSSSRENELRSELQQGPSTSQCTKFTNGSRSVSTVAATRNPSSSTSNGGQQRAPTFVLRSLGPPTLHQENMRLVDGIRFRPRLNAEIGRPFDAHNHGQHSADSEQSRGVILTAEQRDQLQRLRNQLTEADLMNWSEYFRRLAFERARSRAVAQLASLHQQQMHAHGQGVGPAQPSPIREEEEEVVMDPFSSEGDEDSESRGGGSSSAGAGPSTRQEDTGHTQNH
uniref:Frizzled/Smoothened transmembrane domain-containing protein n=1 Tax=Ascaris lumbricoides TaxID=6252 RepID=A0A9J2PE30_ASCLU